MQNTLAEFKNIIDQTWSNRFLMNFSALYEKEKNSSETLTYTKSFEPLIRYIMENNKKVKLAQTAKGKITKIEVENVDAKMIYSDYSDSNRHDKKQSKVEKLVE